jgi:hypothetical protein
MEVYITSNDIGPCPNGVQWYCSTTNMHGFYIDDSTYILCNNRPLLIPLNPKQVLCSVPHDFDSTLLQNKLGPDIVLLESSRGILLIEP